MNPLPSPGNGAATARETVESMGPLMRIVCWVLVSVSGLFLSLRLYCKYLKNPGRGLWWDDHVLIMAWLALVADTTINTINLDLGFGMHLSDIPPAHLPTIGLLSNVSTSLAFLGAVWSKTSFGMTLLRITDGRTKAAVWFVMVSMNAAVSASIVISWVQCDPLPRGGRDVAVTAGRWCWDPRVNVYYMVFAAAYSGVMDIVLALLPWPIIWKLQMKRKEKMGVALAMSMGVFAGCAAFVKSTKIPLVLGGDFTYEGYDLVIWGGAEVAITICAASVPLLRVLIREVRSLTRQRYGYVQAGDGGGGGAGAGSAPDDEETARHKRDASSSSSSSNGSRPSGEAEKGQHRWTLDLRRDSYRGAAFAARPGETNTPPRPPPGAAAAGGKIQRVSEFELQYHRRQEKGDDDETAGRMV
ncbi:hypothetical protein QBC39DRAFT_389658 [Podospora conica]|nr:hypothetical protein QBC39DRAFT_389658 [Schizothecium conicum]